MATWASRRKFIYGGSVVVALVLIVVAVFFSIFYKKPTCLDGVKNGSELGIDCGGACKKLCQSAFLPPKIEWGGAKFEKVAPGLYNVASYIVNPNPNTAAVNVPYKFSLFDSKGVLITEQKGMITLPARRNTLAFEPAVNVAEHTPVKATFEFLSPPLWFKSHDTLDGLTILDKKYEEGETSSSLAVTLENKSLVTYSDITVAAVLYDMSGNVIGFSRTILDALPPRGRDTAPFTWPFGRQGRVVSVEVLPTVTPPRD